MNNLKNEIAYFMRRLYRQKLTTTSGGNISYKINNDLFLVTPSASDKGECRGQEIGLVDSNAKPLSNNFKPSIETGMHSAVFKKRQDISAIVHAHPAVTGAFAASKMKINNRLLGESYAILGNIEYAPYYLMGSEKLAETVANCAENSNCIIMRNHGAITLGKTILEAFDRLEVLETAAKTSIISINAMHNDAVELNKNQLDELDLMMNRKERQ